MGMEQEQILEIRDLAIEFVGAETTTSALRGVNLQLKKGETLGLVGESGSGKSVTAQGIMGLLPPTGRVTAGEIWFQSAHHPPRDLLTLPENEKRLLRGQAIAQVFQEPMSALNPVYNLDFQLTEGIMLHGQVSRVEARRQAIARLQEVKLIPQDRELVAQYYKAQGQTPPPELSLAQCDRPVLKYVNGQKQNFLKRYPHQLSGGQLQRVMIAMAIASNPSLLIADEPTTALDVTVQATILDLLRELCQARSMSLIFITHDLGVIGELVDRVAVMYRGEIVEQGPVEEIFLRPHHPYTQGLIACRPRLDMDCAVLPTVADFMAAPPPDRLADADAEAIPSPRETRSHSLGVPGDRPDVTPNSDLGLNADSTAEAKPLLSVRQLQVGYPQKNPLGWLKGRSYFMAVKNLSFDIFPGETLGLVGESGCGKSTLARTILRLTPALGGKIQFQGEDLTQLEPTSQKLRNLRRQMQIIFQNPYNSLNPRMAIGEAIREPMEIYRVYGSKAQQKKRVAALLERVGLDPAWYDRFPHELSGGQRQRVCIGRALALQPQLIICDESVSALDVSVQAQVLNLLKELQSDFQLTYLFISHDLSVVKFMSDRIMVMNRGELEELDTAARIYKNPQSDYTRQLIAAIPKDIGA